MEIVKCPITEIAPKCDDCPKPCWDGIVRIELVVVKEHDEEIEEYPPWR